MLIFIVDKYYDRFIIKYKTIYGAIYIKYLSS